MAAADSGRSLGTTNITQLAAILTLILLALAFERIDAQAPPPLPFAYFVCHHTSNPEFCKSVLERWVHSMTSLNRIQTYTLNHGINSAGNFRKKLGSLAKNKNIDATLRQIYSTCQGLYQESKKSYETAVAAYKAKNNNCVERELTKVKNNIASCATELSNANVPVDEEGQYQENLVVLNQDLVKIGVDDDPTLSGK